MKSWMCLRLTHRVYLLRVMAETQPKPGNLYSPGTSGKKSVHERDKMKKAKIKNTPPPPKKNKTGEEPGQWSVMEARGRATLADVSIPSLQTALSIIPVHGRMLCVEQGLKCKFIKMKWLLYQSKLKWSGWVHFRWKPPSSEVIFILNLP